jgi:hypothetical protein
MAFTVKTTHLSVIAAAGLFIHVHSLTLQAQPVAVGGPGNFRVAPNLGNLAAYSAGTTRGAQVGAVAGFRQGQLAAPFYGGGFYPPYYDPLGGYTSGLADMMNAQGQVLKDIEESGLMHEQLRQAHIDTRRKNFDEWLYEREMRPTPEDEREKQRIENVRRSRNDPPQSEIFSGLALNNLLTAIQQMHAQRVEGPRVYIDPNTRQHLNLTSGATTGSVGLLQNGAKLQWPLPLQRAPFAADRQRLDDLMPAAYKQAATGAVQADVLDGMITAVNNMYATIKRNIADITPTDYSRAKTYLRQVEETIKGLQDPNVTKYVTRQWAVHADTIGEMVAQLTQQGLKFAPATSGDEAAYLATHAGMVQYYQWPSRPWDPVAK